jgi:Spx/MgsR family transcriptional regulator
VEQRTFTATSIAKGLHASGDSRLQNPLVISSDLPIHSAMLKLYAYQGCSTCRNAIKWLKSHDIPFQEAAIRETPPKIAELKAMLAARGGELRALFNTSGMDYRAMALKDKLPSMSTDDALKLLSENGNLVKRPFALDQGKAVHLVGFKEQEWKTALLKR